jgi:hypothetical protein
MVKKILFVFNKNFKMKRNILIFTVLLFLSSLAFAQEFKEIGFNDKLLNYSGRIEKTDSIAKFYWPGSSVQIKVKNTKTVKAILSENIDVNYYDVIIDENYTQKIKILKGKHTYVLASNLNKKRHTIQIFKATNNDGHVTGFYGFIVDSNSKVINQRNKQKLKMEFFGNSITCGHGVEVPVGSPDSGKPEFFNNYHTYGAITSRYFNAQYHCSAKSGIGIAVSWFDAIMPDIYDRLNPNDPNSKWDFTKYQPDIVVVNLFQNDSWIVNMPKEEQFKIRFGSEKPSDQFMMDSYTKFISSIRKVYPHAKIICALGNMDITKKGSKWPGLVDKATKSLNDPNVYTHFFKYKDTDGHPKIAEQQAMADDLILFIKENKLDKF